MQKELKCLHDNKTWDLVGRRKGRKVLNKKWVYRVKREGKEN